jgi:hypothetical protein
MIFIQCEDHFYHAKTWKGIVKIMWRMSFDEAVSKDKFMFNVKERIKQLYGKHVERLQESVTEKNFEKFCKALEQISLVKIYYCPECINYIAARQCAVQLQTSPFKCECNEMKIKMPQDEFPK